MGSSPGTQRVLQKWTRKHTQTRTCTQTIPRVLIIRHGIRSLRFNVLKASKCSFLHVKAYLSIYKNRFFKRPAGVSHMPVSISTVPPLCTGMYLAQGSFISRLQTHCWSAAVHAWSSPEMFWTIRRQVFPLFTLILHKWICRRKTYPHDSLHQYQIYSMHQSPRPIKLALLNSGILTDHVIAVMD